MDEKEFVEKMKRNLEIIENALEAKYMSITAIILALAAIIKSCFG